MFALLFTYCVYCHFFSLMLCVQVLASFHCLSPSFLSSAARLTEAAITFICNLLLSLVGLSFILPFTILCRRPSRLKK